MAGAFRVKVEGLYIGGERYKAGETLSAVHASKVPDYFIACNFIEAVKPGSKPRTTSKQARQRISK